MADEIKKVIQIDTADSITSLKEYKKHIDELRGALLQLDETSEEYQDIAKEIAAEQDKLNAVMQAGKTTTDAAEGSYNQLVQTMAELKKQWRATADEAERADLGNQILEINNKLKDLDASTGNFQRNVGDYANAFEEAFKNGLSILGQNNDMLKSVSGDITRMIPLIKKVTTTATAGLSGVKKALVSTGIGALIVALGVVLAHWEDISEWIKKATGYVDEHAEAIKKLEGYVDNLKEKHNDLKGILEYENGLYEAAGATREQVLKKQLDDQKALVNEAFAEEMRLYNAWSLNKDNVDRKMVEARKKAADDAEAYRRELEAEYEKIAARLNIERERLITDNLQMVAEFDASLQEQADLLKQHFDEMIAAAGTSAHTQLAAYEEYLNGLNALIEANKAEQDAANEAAKAAERAAEERRKQWEQERQAALNLAEAVRQASLNELQALDEKYAKEKAQLERFGLDVSLLTQQYEENRLKIIQAQEDAVVEAYQNAEEARHNAILAAYEAEAEQATFEIDNSLEVMTEQQVADAKYQIERDLMDKKIALQQEYLESYDEFLQQQLEEGQMSQEEYASQLQQRQELEAQLQAYLQESANLEKARAKEVADYENAQAKLAADYKKAVWQTSMSAIGSIFGSLSDMMEDGSDEAKALAVMEATVNTLSGAIGGFMQATASYPPPYGQIIGAATAAAATAAGIAQIAKINSTSKSSASSGASITTPQVQTPEIGAIVSPLLDEKQDIQGMTSLNVDGDSTSGRDNRVYVVESDITDTQNRVEVRESESTF